MTWTLAWCVVLGLSCVVSIEFQGSLENVARNKTTGQSSDYTEGGKTLTSDLAVDGDKIWSSCTHTNPDLVNWWYVDLGSQYTVDFLRITNKANSQGYRLRQFKILGSRNDFNTNHFNEQDFTNNYGLELCGEQIDSVADGATVNFTCSHMQARYIYIVKVDTGGNNNQILTLCEVEVFAAPITTTQGRISTTTTNTTPITTTTKPVTKKTTPKTTTTHVATITTPVTKTTPATPTSVATPVTTTATPVSATTTSVTPTTPITTTTTSVSISSTASLTSTPSTTTFQPSSVTSSTTDTAAVYERATGGGDGSMEFYIGVGAAAGVLVILIVVLVLVVLFVRKKEAKSQENPHDSTDLTGLEESNPQLQIPEDWYE